MTYTVGIGLLFDAEHFNKVRAIELDLAEKTGNDRGLRQPPHVTVKRPFEITGSGELDQVAKIVSTVASVTSKVRVEFDGAGYFGDKVAYLRAVETKQLTDLHERLAGALQKVFDESAQEFEGSQMVFHTTLMSNLTEEEFKATSQLLGRIDVSGVHFSSTANHLGLFLSLDSGLNWIVISQFPLEG